MGLKFGREYTDIISDISLSLLEIEGLNDFFEMTDKEWNNISVKNKKEYVKTLADDIFYALGNENVLEVGKGSINYVKDDNAITIFNKDIKVNTISLI